MLLNGDIAVDGNFISKDFASPSFLYKLFRMKTSIIQECSCSYQSLLNNSRVRRSNKRPGRLCKGIEIIASSIRFSDPGPKEKSFQLFFFRKFPFRADVTVLIDYKSSHVTLQRK